MCIVRYPITNNTNNNVVLLVALRFVTFFQAVFDNDVDYLEILLDHAIAAQEDELEAMQGMSPNGNVDPPVSERYVRGREGSPSVPSMVVVVGVAVIVVLVNVGGSGVAVFYSCCLHMIEW